MSQSKEFSSEAEKTFYLVANTHAKVSVNNFAKLYEQLQSKKDSEEVRNTIGIRLLNSLERSGFLTLSDRQRKIFQETPSEFRPKIHPGSPQKPIVENYIEIMKMCNVFFKGYYPVSLELQTFLLARNNDFFSKNEKIVSDSKKWVEDFKERVVDVQKQIDSDIPVKNFSVSKLRKSSNNLLVRIILALSKALDESKEFFGEKMVEEANGLLVLFEESKAEQFDVPRENPLMLTEQEKEKKILPVSELENEENDDNEEDEDDEEEDEEEDDEEETSEYK